MLGLVIVGRDYVEATLAEDTPEADQALAQADGAGRGHAQNRSVMGWLRTRGRVVRAR